MNSVSNLYKFRYYNYLEMEDIVFWCYIYK